MRYVFWSADGARLRREGDFADCDEIFETNAKASEKMLNFATGMPGAPAPARPSILICACALPITVHCDEFNK